MADYRYNSHFRYIHKPSEDGYKDIWVGKVMKIENITSEEYLKMVLRYGNPYDLNYDNNGFHRIIVCDTSLSPIFRTYSINFSEIKMAFIYLDLLHIQCDKTIIRFSNLCNMSEDFDDLMHSFKYNGWDIRVELNHG